MIHDILDLHTHTIMSGHAYSTMQEMIRSASEKDVKLLGITEHAPRIPGACHPFYFINFKVVPREQFGVKLILGCELNIIDYEGHIDLEPRYLNGLDYAVASIHEPCYDSGTVAQNTESGIFGTMTDDSLYSELQCVPVASADEIKVGDAEILSNVDGDSVQRYSVQIVKLYPANDEYGRSMMLRVTDSQLAEKTGGIVQGMSGSPILQNGKLIGAVTHVLVDNPMEGYGISMEKMLKAS